MMCNFNQRPLVLPHTIRTDNSLIVLNELIGQGGFSNVYRGVKVLNTGSNICAVKIGGNLSHEQDVMNALLKKSELDKFFSNVFCLLPQVVDTGYDVLSSFSFITMDEYPMSLNDYMINYLQNGRMDLHDVNDVAKNLLDALCFLSKCGVIHQDIKSKNIMLKEKDNLSYCILIDYGTAQLVDFKEIKDEVNGKIMEENIYITPMYSAISIHEGSRKSFKDDLQAFFFNIYEWLTGELPWVRCKQNYIEIYRMKKELYYNFSGDNNLSFKENNFLLLLVNTIRNLNLNEYPDYMKLKLALNDINLSRIEENQIEYLSDTLNENKTGFYTLDVTQYFDVVSKLEKISLDDKIILKILKNPVDVSNVIRKTRAVGILMHFEKMRIRGFVYAYKTFCSTDITGSENLKNCARKRLNYQISPLQSLLRGLVSLIKTFGVKNEKEITIVIVEPVLFSFLKSLHDDTITGKGEKLVDSLKNVLRDYRKVIENVEKLRIIFAEVNGYVKAIQDTQELVENAIQYFEEEN
uniref:non-specific serine/threonine protein kinase n=1 Tax=Strongyloides venezuelensis TaxID=75913 RepID=A0A0K0FTI8_STRVS